jgi:hypothetical protein
MPPVADEPYRFPFDSLASRVTILPIATTRSISTSIASRSMRARVARSGLRYMLFGLGPRPILRSWSTAVALVQGTPEYGYERFRSHSRGVKSKVKELTGQLSTEGEKALALFSFVRDQIVTEHYFGVTVGDGTAQRTLKQGRGDYAEKAVLLQHMLDVVDIDASVAWTSPADLIRIDTEHADLGQLQYPLVVVDIDGKRVFLDPGSDLGFGQLKPETEGTPCLLVDRRNPEWITTPTTPAEDSGRLVRLELRLDQQGGLSGSGKLIVFGHDAWRRLNLNLNREALSDAWLSWLWRSFPGYDLANVTLRESSELRRIELTWQLQQRQDEILGDEASVAPSTPLTFSRTPFTLPAEQRTSPVHLPFCYTDRVELHLSWDEGWVVDSLPDLRSLANGAGYLSTGIVVEGEKRELTATRQLQVSRRDHVGSSEYEELRALYQSAVANDDEAVVLVKADRLSSGLVKR